MWLSTLFYLLLTIPGSTPLLCTSRSIGGFDPNRPSKVNQDAYFARNQYFGVMDGHGKHGEKLTKYLADIFPDIICGQYHQSKRIEELERQIEELGGYATKDDHPLVHAFHQAQLQAMNEPTVNAGRCGTTCIVAAILGNKVEVAYVGDSKAILIREAECIPLAEATTVKMKDERERIERGDGSIVGNNVFYGPQGIAMTRALGDCVMLRAGVIPTPIVKSVEVKKDDIIVLATDGVWDVLSDEIVASIVKDSRESACETIVERSREGWIGDLPLADESPIDDITCMVIQID